MLEHVPIGSARAGFVGRVPELTELRAGLERARGGEGQFFLISGEPGIGKTRLAEEVAAQAAAAGTAVLRAQCWEGIGTPAYWPLVQIIRAALAGPDRSSFRNSLYAADLPRDLDQLLPELNTAERGRDATSLNAAPDVEQARFRLLEAVSTALKTMAAIKPLLLIIEDLHAAEQPPLLMLHFVATQLRDAPVMLVVTYCGLEVQRAPALSSMIGGLVRQGIQIPLGALSQDDAGRMITERAGTPPNPRLVSDIYQATAGNPLFIDGLVRVLSAEGRLSGGGRLNLAAFRVPDGVREAIRRWLELVSNRTVLVVAAAIGQQFELKCLQRVTGLTAYQLLDVLRQAWKLGLVIPLQRGAYRFTHALIRNALHDELDSAQRAETHGKIAEAIEELYQIDVEVHAAALALHFREAGDNGKAIDYSIRAGDCARAVFAYEEAIAHWESALELMPQGIEGGERRAALLERTAELLGLTAAESERQFEYWRQALKLYQDLQYPEAAARVEARIVGWLNMRGSSSNLLGSHQDEQSLILPGQDRESRISSFWRLNTAATLSGTAGHVQEALAASEQAMQICIDLNEPALHARASIAYASNVFASGEVGRALEIIDRVSAEAGRLDDSITTVGIHTVDAHVLSWLCDPRQEAERLERELGKPRMVEALQLRAVLKDWLQLLAALAGTLPDDDQVVPQIQTTPPAESLVAFYRGHWERAAQLLAQAVDRAGQNGRRTTVCALGYWLAKVHRALGRDSGAQRFLRESLAISSVAPHIPLELRTRMELASMYAQDGRADQAETELARCREIVAQGQDWRGALGHLAKAEALAAVAQSSFEPANHYFERAVDIFRRYEVPFEEAEALHYWGYALIAAGEPNAGAEKLDGAAALYRRHGAGERWLELIEADRLRAQGGRERVASGDGSDNAAQLPPGGAAADQADPPLRNATFRRQGEYWTLSWTNGERRLRDRRGLQYIASLLRYPGQEFAAHDLAARVEGDSSGNRGATLEPGSVEVISKSLGDSGAPLDSTAKAQYRRRLIELNEELAQAQRHNDLGRADRLREELDSIERELAAAVGLGGRDRKAGSPAERARLSVTKAIKTALLRIREADADMGRHLSLSIQTGYFCAYHPRQPVTWDL